MTTKSYIDGHISGDIAWVDMIFVSREDGRLAGKGRKLYREWEANLPENIEMVIIMASDTGSGPSDDFWDKMGFCFQYQGSELSYEAEHAMRKGVNGHPTPRPINVEENEDNFKC
jgi:hypothetical protein